MLPDLKNSKVKVKVQLRNYYPAQLGYGTKMYDDVKLNIQVAEKKTGKIVGNKTLEGISKRDNLSEIDAEINIPSPKAWAPEDPFLYEAKVEVLDDQATSDVFSDHFGMRDFKRNGKYFYLNGQKNLFAWDKYNLAALF